MHTRESLTSRILLEKYNIVNIPACQSYHSNKRHCKGIPYSLQIFVILILAVKNIHSSVF